MRLLSITAITISLLAISFCIFDLMMWNEGCKTCNLYQLDDEPHFGLDGIYNPNGDYYAIWTRGRTFQEINDTEHHEVCHVLVNENKKHFCEEAFK